MKHCLVLSYARVLSVALLLLAPIGHSAKAQSSTKTYRLDSTVVRSSDGSERVQYFVRSIDLGSASNKTKSAQRSRAMAVSDRFASSADQFIEKAAVPRAKAAASSVVVDNTPRITPLTNLSSYSVGAIPLNAGMTLTGGRTYQIPIATAKGIKMVPSISLAYNSQASEGFAGFGWNIAGISTITLIDKTPYFHGVSKGANIKDTDAVFALDGVPLVPNTQSETMTEFPLITASGKILVAPVKNSYGYVYSFNVKYPDGSSAEFGVGISTWRYNNLYYPISCITDKDGHKITFFYPQSGDRPDKIRYDYNSSGQYKGEIIFDYVQDGHFARYYAGEQASKTQRLQRIISKYDGAIISQYTFSYEEVDNVSLLTSVDCSSGGKSLPPLRFEYGATYYQRITPKIERGSGMTLPRNFNADDETDYYYKRGKFVAGSYNDGLIIYPQMDNYGVTASYKPFLSKRHYQYGSLYPEDQDILFAPCLGVSNQVYSSSIKTGSGFQTIEAVDVDGDGLDELVKVNFKGTNGNSTSLLFTIYKCSAPGSLTQVSQFQTDVNGIIKDGDYTSPYRREYFWGDFRGNGKVQLLTIAYDKNYNNQNVVDQVSYAALIDLSTHVKLCDSKLFDYTSLTAKRVLVCDLDNDAQTELCYATLTAGDSSMDVYRFGTSSFVKEKTISGPDSSVWLSKHYITDVNGDGYIDFMVPPLANGSFTWARYAYTGNEFVKSEIDLFSNSGEVFFCDVNQDGCADIMQVSGTSSSANLYYYINRGGGNSWGACQKYSGTIRNKEGIVAAHVADNSGASCFILVDGMFADTFYYTTPSPRLRQLTASVDSYGKMIVNTYKYLPDKNSITEWWDESLTVNNANGYAFRILPLYVLYKEEAYIAANLNSPQYLYREYNYFNGVTHNQGLGFCGFTKIRTYDYTDRPTVVIIDELHDPQKRGVVTSVTKRHSSATSTPYLTVTNTYDNNSTTYGKLNPRLTKTVESNTVTGVTTTTTCTYGSYDLPTKVVTSRRIGSGTAQTETISRTYQNSVSPSKYILGAIKEESVNKDLDGDNTVTWAERTVNTYDSNYHLTSSKRYVGNAASTIVTGKSTTIVTYGKAANLESETRWQYDSFGNVTSRKTASYGATTFVGETYTYDSEGCYMLTETDALGHTTTYSGYDAFGQPATIKDYRNRTTTCVYDVWGNLTKKTYSDGAVVTITPTWGGSELYTVTCTTTGQPETIVHYDALGREVRTGQKRFNGKWQYLDKLYDDKGRLQKTSLPYRGASATYWNTYDYDSYDRPTCVTEASGKVTTWSYSGTSTTKVKEGISSTSTVDASGNVIRVVDAGGTITYTLRDDGQPVSITAPGNVKTTVEYDDYGRKTKIVDPSAGTQTDSYVWNSNGSSVQTHINPNGTIKTYTDKYGRVTKIERPGEYTTTYTYNSYGLLTKEQSTNGTSTEYTYDAKDRVSTVKETVPDGKWLKKTYTYASGSVLSKIAYEAQSGTITTETYTYANGHNTKIALADGTVVWNLTAENDLGLPTAGTTGSITREYGYTAFGMPTYRRMAGGALQDMRYQFDPATGNLTMRRDETRDKTENFTYDNLNRLTKIGARQITYDTKGNILRIGGVGTMTYDSSAHPYQVTSLTTASSSVVANRAQSVSYTCYSRPSTLTEGSRSAAFTYNGDGDRVKMYEASGSTQVLTRYYIGDRYEFDQTSSGTKERLYVGGDAYSAPMVYQREGSGSWAAYNIGRDYLGNITHIATATGTLVAEYSYDPWGRLRNPSTLSIYAPGKEPELFLGRGFTGHEHLSWFGLINMNARLYDPVVGRFLSPDPYVQAPDFTQNFNRYSYALNNPLKYTDESGEVVVTTVVVAALASAAVCMAIDYGMQVLMNYIQSYRDPTMTTKDIFLNRIDWFDVGMSGILGAFTGGTSAVATAAEKAGTAVPKLAKFALKYRRAIELTESAITSAIDITGEGWQKVSLDDFMERMLLSISFTAVSDVVADLSARITSKKTPAIPDDAPLPDPFPIDIEPNNLNEQLAIEEAMRSPQGKLIIPAEDINDIRWKGWDKMQYNHYNNLNIPDVIKYNDNPFKGYSVHYFQAPNGTRAGYKIANPIKNPKK